MTDTFDPGPGWRESELGSIVPKGKRTLWEYNENGVPLRTWVREEPVPPLPTAPHTVIRVTWKDTGEQERLVLSDSGTWWGPLMADGLRERITGFKVLSEPRAVTAKAVLDAAREISLIYRKASGQGVEEFMEHLDKVAEEFGVFE